MALNIQSRSYFITTILILIFTPLPSIATINIDCKGKAFHCVNSTHFKICVDFGGISKTVDDFLIPCPESTVCKDSNYFECEYQTTTTPVSVIVQSDVTNEQSESTLTSASDINDVTTLFRNNVSKTELFENYYDTENTIALDSNFEVTEATNSFTNINDSSLPLLKTTNSEMGDQETLKPNNLRSAMNNLSDNNTFIDITTHSYSPTGSNIARDFMEADLMKNLRSGSNGEQYDTTTSTDFVTTSIPFFNEFTHSSTKNQVFENQEQDIIIEREHNNEWLSDKYVDNETIATNNVEQTSLNKQQLSKQTVLQFPTTTETAIVINAYTTTDINENLNSGNNSFSTNIANISISLKDEQHLNYVETTTEAFSDLDKSLNASAEENKIQLTDKMDAVMTTTEESPNAITLSDPLYDLKHFTKGIYDTHNIELPTTRFESILNTIRTVSMPSINLSGFEDVTTQDYSPIIETETTTKVESDFLLDEKNRNTFPSSPATTESSTTIRELTTDITTTNFADFKNIDDLHMSNIEKTTIQADKITEPINNNLITIPSISGTLSNTVQKLESVNETYALATSTWESPRNTVYDKTITDIHIPSIHLLRKDYVTTPATTTVNLFPTIMDMLKNTFLELPISKSVQLLNNSYETKAENNDLFFVNVTDIPLRKENTVKTDIYFPKTMTKSSNDLLLTVAVHEKTLNDTITSKSQIQIVTPNKLSPISRVTEENYIIPGNVTTETFTSSSVTAETFLQSTGYNTKLSPLGNNEDVTPTTVVTEISNAEQHMNTNYDRNRNVSLYTTTLHTYSYTENYNEILSINLTEPSDMIGSISSKTEKTPITLLDVLSTPETLAQETSTKTASEVDTFNNYTYNLTKITSDIPSSFFPHKSTDKFDEDKKQNLNVTTILDLNKTDLLSTKTGTFSDKEFKLSTIEYMTTENNTRSEESSIAQVEHLINTNATYTTNTFFENVTIPTSALQLNELLPKNNLGNNTSNIHSSKSNMQRKANDEDNVVTDTINDVTENPVTESQNELFGSLTTFHSSESDKSLYNLPIDNIMPTILVSVTELLYEGTVNDNIDGGNLKLTEPDIIRVSDSNDSHTTEMIKTESSTREHLGNSTDFLYRSGGNKTSNDFHNISLPVKLDVIVYSNYLENSDAITIRTNEINKGNKKISDSINYREKDYNETTWVNKISDEKQKTLNPNSVDEDKNRFSINNIKNKFNKTSQLMEIKNKYKKIESNKITGNLFNTTLPYHSPLSNISSLISFGQPSAEAKVATGHLFSDTLDVNSYNHNLNLNITQLNDKHTIKLLPLNKEIFLDSRNKSYVNKADKAEIKGRFYVESEKKLEIQKKYDYNQTKSHTLNSIYAITPIVSHIDTNEDKNYKNLSKDAQVITRGEKEKTTMKSDVSLISSLNLNKFIKSNVLLGDLAQIKNASVTTVSSNTVQKLTNQTTQVLQKNESYNPVNDKFKISNSFNCNDYRTGKYADRNNCSKFYICIGRNKPIIGTCPNNTVFSEIKKQCTKNLSHCIRDKQFQCTSIGRYIDLFSDQFYYICVKKAERFIRLKLQCQKGYLLERTKVQCVSVSQNMSNEDSSNITRDSSTFESTSREDKKTNFECEKEGKFVYPGNCRKYYVCTKNSKSEIRRRIKKCDSDEIFNKENNKCVDEDSYECTT